METPYLKLIGKTYEEVLQLSRPLTVDKLAELVKTWFEKMLAERRFVTRAAYNKLLSRKTNAIVRVLKTISPQADLAMEISLRKQISDKCLNC